VIQGCLTVVQPPVPFSGPEVAALMALPPSKSPKRVAEKFMTTFARKTFPGETWKAAIFFEKLILGSLITTFSALYRSLWFGPHIFKITESLKIPKSIESLVKLVRPSKSIVIVPFQSAIRRLTGGGGGVLVEGWVDFFLLQPKTRRIGRVIRNRFILLEAG